MKKIVSGGAASIAGVREGNTLNYNTQIQASLLKSHISQITRCAKVQLIAILPVLS